MVQTKKKSEKLSKNKVLDASERDRRQDRSSNILHATRFLHISPSCGILMVYVLKITIKWSPPQTGAHSQIERLR